MSKNEKQFEKLKKRVEEMSERGQDLRRRELVIADKVKYLLALLHETHFQSYNQKILDILAKYKQLHARQQNLLEDPMVSPDQQKDFNDYQSKLQDTIKEIAQLEAEKERIKSKLETTYAAQRLQNGKFLFSLKAPDFETK